MSDQSINRRNFLKLLGIGTATVGASITVPKLIAMTTNGMLVESKDEYSDFLVEKLTSGKYPYKYKPDILKQMSTKMTIFNRNFWDHARKKRPELTENLTYENLVKGKGKIPNQTRLDYALMAASWCVSSGRHYPSYKWEAQSGRIKNLVRLNPEPWSPADLDMSWKDASIAVKHAALFYGASLAGITKLNPLWIYSDNFAPSRDNREHTIPVLADEERFEKTDDAWYIPKSMNRVIALAFEEDYHAISNSPGRLASAATGNGYSRMAFTSFTLAEFIRALGYRAIPSGNGVGLSIPIAIDAGLGELGRMGLIVTPKYGPRVRLAKVITDMPLIPDPPISFGVTEFCKTCKLCAIDCPSGSISKNKRTWKGKSPSNNPGTYKWYIEPETCYDYNGFSCSNCKRICPFNKPNNSWLHQMIRKIIKARIHIVDKTMKTFDRASGYGKQTKDTKFWKMKGTKSITARDST